MVSLSKRNKRTSLHQKYKVAKKVRQHHREVKKSLKNVKPKKELPLAMQMPMELPFKDKIIKELEASNLMEKEAEKRRMVALRILKKNPPVNLVEEMKAKLIKDSSRAFIGDIRKLIDESDVVLIVLDARDPMGTRSLETENLIRAANKTIIFVLNKIDLVPLENMKAWRRYLSKEAKTFPFKASCQEQAKKLGHNGGIKPNVNLNTSGASFGVDIIINYLKSINKKSIGGSSTPGGKSADKLIIGVAGVPNTGKSSVINSFKRKRICEAGNVAGLTRNLQHVALDNHITLIDSPGIVLSKSNDPAEYALRNCIRVEKIDDPVTVAEAIYKRYKPIQLQFLYKLEHFDNVTDFMLAFATRLCPLKKGGIPNLKLAAVKLINDWNKGKISYCSEPPVLEDLDNDNLVDIENAGLENITLNGTTNPKIAVLKNLHTIITDVPLDEMNAEGDKSDDVDMDQ